MPPLHSKLYYLVLFLHDIVKDCFCIRKFYYLAILDYNTNNIMACHDKGIYYNTMILRSAKRYSDYYNLSVNYS